MSELTPERLLSGYAKGIFPMAEHREDTEVFWVDPRRRGVFPLDGFHVSRSLAAAMRKTTFQPAVNRDFDAVVAACADRAETWINRELTHLYSALHDIGHAQSYELWEADTLVGGVYGVTLGAAFFGESMFSRRTNASKMALAGLIVHLRAGGFTLFDTQFITDHLATLGAIEVSRGIYRAQLADALKREASFTGPDLLSLQDVLQRITQTS